MEEATALCDRVAIMHQGKVLSLDAPQKLISRYVGSEVWEIEVNSEDRERTVKELASRGLDFEDVWGKIEVFHIETDKSIRGLTNPPERLRRRPATLEDVFFRLTGRSLTE
jgi:lipooligosaccharide transport system ATP-binding protein